MPKFWKHALERMYQRGITKEEIEEVYYGVHLKRKIDTGRYLIYGKSESGKYILIVIVKDEIITAREMTKKEKQLFKKKGK